MNTQYKEVAIKVTANVLYNRMKGDSSQSVKDIASYSAAQALNTLYLQDMIRPALPAMFKANVQNPSMQIVENLMVDLIGVGASFYVIENYVRKTNVSVMETAEQVLASDVALEALKKINML